MRKNVSEIIWWYLNTEVASAMRPSKSGQCCEQTSLLRSKAPEGPKARQR